MPEKRKRSEGFDAFLAEYKAAKVPETKKPINSSKFTLKQQLERFAKFSHTEDESNIMLKEANAL